MSKYIFQSILTWKGIILNSILHHPYSDVSSTYDPYTKASGLTLFHLLKQQTHTKRSVTEFERALHLHTIFNSIINHRPISSITNDRYPTSTIVKQIWQQYYNCNTNREQATEFPQFGQSIQFEEQGSHGN